VIPPTTSQTIGPFFHFVADPAMRDLTRFGASGRRIVVHGRVLDGDGANVSDACVETWQVVPPVSERFPGWGRCATDAEGRYRLITIAPGPVDAADGRHAPHLAITVFARGLLKPVHTRCYFDGEPLNRTDPVLSRIDSSRRATLFAAPDVAEAENHFRFDVRLQGARETVFFDLAPRP